MGFLFCKETVGTGIRRKYCTSGPLAQMDHSSCQPVTFFLPFSDPVANFTHRYWYLQYGTVPYQYLFKIIYFLILKTSVVDPNTLNLDPDPDPGYTTYTTNFEGKKLK